MGIKSRNKSEATNKECCCVRGCGTPATHEIRFASGVHCYCEADAGRAHRQIAQPHLLPRPIQLACILALVCIPRLAPAQASEPTPSSESTGFQREGFLVGLGLGQGWIIPNCDNCETEPGVALEFHIGSMITSNAALMLDVSSVIHTYGDGSTLAQDAYMLASQFWPTLDPSGRSWAKVGIGYPVLRAQDGAGDDLLEVEGGLSTMVALGYEVYRRTSFAADGQLSLVSAKYGDLVIHNFALTVGVNWY